MASINLQVGVKIFLKNKDGKYLLLRRNPSKYVEIKSEWDVVGGRIEPGSKLIDNIIREIKEETQLEIISTPILFYAQDIFIEGERHVVRLSYTGNTDGEPILDTGENTEYRWLSPSEMKVQKNLDIYVKEIIDLGLIK